MCGGRPELGLRQVGIDAATARQKHRRIVLRVEMVASRRQLVEPDGALDIRFGADPAFELERHLEHRPDMTALCGVPEMPVRQLRRGRRIACPAHVDKAERLLGRGVAALRMRGQDGDRLRKAARLGSRDPRLKG